MSEKKKKPPVDKPKPKPAEPKPEAGSTWSPISTNMPPEWFI